ncbi:MAG: TPM domain-containing protein [Treponema sp.]|jgi:uncharacterized protein|nr:TPM domain-containing protein [Treponema sp.]
MKIKRLPFLPVLFAILAGTAFAQERIVDNAGLLSDSQKEDLRRLTGAIYQDYSFDLVIVTERTIGSTSPMNYADDYFDYNGYSQNGCLFLLVTGSRDYWISTAGTGIEILNSYAYSKLENDTVSFLSAGNYYEAYLAFIQDWELFLSLDKNYRSYNFFYAWNSVLVAVSWIIAFVIGLIVVHVWKTGMDTALPQRAAAAYVVPGSLAFKVKRDDFLYSTVTRTRRQTETSSSGGGGIHTGSSGRSHGGGGGRY